MLESLEHAKKRGARIYATLTGYGLSGDAHHITSPSEDGRGAKLCMYSAMRQAGLLNEREKITYVNAHATSTPPGDVIEARAISSLLPKSTLVSSTKGALGHALGAAGAIEAVLSVLCIRDNIVPHTLNLEELGKDIKDINLDFVMKEPRKIEVMNVMSNSFGFGGTNTSLLFSRYNS